MRSGATARLPTASAAAFSDGIVFVNHPPLERSRTGSTSPALLLVLVGTLLLGALAAWWFLGRDERRVAPPAPVATSATAESAIPAAVDAAAVVEPSRTDDPAFRGALNEAAVIRVKDRVSGKIESKPVFELDGKVVNDRDSAPVYYFQVWLIPEAMGDPATAKGTLSPSHMRNGRLHLDHQLGGTYHLVVESREHEPVTKLIQLPYEGDLEVRLRYGTCVRGVVRDSFQTPLKDIELQLVVDLARIDSGFKPPMQRMVKTDENGRYAFWKLPPGTYALKVQLGGDELASEREFRVDPGSETMRDFTLERLGSLRVVVSNPIDQPLARARTALFAQNDDGRERMVRSVTSDLKGLARLEFVREGSYKLKVTVPGYLPHEQTVVVAAGEAFRDIPVRLELAPRAGN